MERSAKESDWSVYSKDRLMEVLFEGNIKEHNCGNSDYFLSHSILLYQHFIDCNAEFCLHRNWGDA